MGLFRRLFAVYFLATAGLLSQASAAPFALPEPIAETIARFKASSEPELQQRAARIEALVQALGNLPLPSTEEALKASDLDQGTIELLRSRSRGIVALSDLSALPIAEGYSLGLSARSGIYEMLSERYDLSPWTVAYPQFRIDWHKVKNHTEIFLGKVQATGKPVVFFVPEKTLSYQGTSITVDEFRWFLKDPARLKNAYFVFGAYGLISPQLEQMREDAGLSSDEFRALFMRALGAASSNYDNAL